MNQSPKAWRKAWQYGKAARRYETVPIVRNHQMSWISGLKSDVYDGLETPDHPRKWAGEPSLLAICAFVPEPVRPAARRVPPYLCRLGFRWLGGAVGVNGGDIGNGGGGVGSQGFEFESDAGS